MIPFIFRRIVYNIPVYLAILLFVMTALRQVSDPIPGFLGKNASEEEYKAFETKHGLDKPFFSQYGNFVASLAKFDLSRESWDRPGVTVGRRLLSCMGVTLALTVPALIITSIISVTIGLVSSYFRDSFIDRGLVVIAVLGMSVSFLVYIILGQYFGAYSLTRALGKPVFSIYGHRPGIWNWAFYMLLPVLISVIVAMGYDTRFYRAAIVEESGQDYITTARAKGASGFQILFVHILRNAMIPIITRIMITLPFLITGSVLLESYFGIPGMGYELISAINSKDFPIIETFTAVFAGVFIISNILTDVCYAIVDPRVRLS